MRVLYLENAPYCVHHVKYGQLLIITTAFSDLQPQEGHTKEQVELAPSMNNIDINHFLQTSMREQFGFC